MFLIAGLGNPDDKYKNNRHNIGFMVIDQLTKSLTNFQNINKTNFQAKIIKSDNILYVKPLTYMNNSGISILNIADYFNIQNDNIIIIHDDLDLPLGTVKFKKGGGDGGHNGLSSIDSHIEKNYLRVRIGIGKPKEKSQVTNWVLGDFSKEEFKLILKIMKHITSSIEALQNLPLEDVKTKFTLKS